MPAWFRSCWSRSRIWKRSTCARGIWLATAWLVETAGLLRKIAGACDTVLRYAGDEFLLILPDRDEEQANEVIQQVSAEVSACNSAAGRQHKLALSLGVATYKEGVDIRELLRRAENSLHPAKKLAASRAAREQTAECLLVSNDSAVQEVMRPILDSIGVSAEFCARADDAYKLMARRKLDAAIVDCDLQGGEQLLFDVRALPSTRGTVMIALTAGEAGRKTGASIVLNKPLNSALTARTMRVAHALMQSERLRYFRHVLATEIPAVFDAGEHRQCAITSISDGGIAVHSAAPLPVGREGVARFQLAENQVEIKAEVVWCDGEGYAGLRFLEITREARARLETWLAGKTAAEDAPTRKARAQVA